MKRGALLNKLHGKPVPVPVLLVLLQLDGADLSSGYGAFRGLFPP